MISTSSYKNFETGMYRRCSISGDRGKGAGSEGDSYPALAPKRELWQVWHDNIGKISEEDNTRYYIEEYYKQVLSKLDPARVYRELEHSTLLCYEDPEDFCHRHVVAAWFNLLLGNTIPPVCEIAWVDGKLTRMDDYAAKYSDILEDVIRKNERMCGFTSVRARYLFDQGEQLEALADQKEAENPGQCFDSYRQSACFRRCDADEAEAEYRAAQKLKKAKGVKQND
jgi:hypothetical protein